MPPEQRSHKSRPHNQCNCCLSESWSDPRSDSFRKECVWLGGNFGPTSCVNILSIPSNLSLSLCISVHVCVTAGLCRLLVHLSYIVSQLLFFFFHIYTISLQLSLHISLPTSTHFHPLHSLPQAELRQAGGLPSWEPRWCLGESASYGSRSLQDGRTALLWPIWPRPVLAPVCGWTSRGTARLALNENTASTQQTGELTAERLTNTLTCDSGAFLLVTTRRHDQQETA